MSRVRSIELQGALAARRNLGVLADRLPWIQKRAIQTLRRRLPVFARRDIQREYNLRAGRITSDLTTATSATGVRLIGYWRGVGLLQFGGRQTRRGVTAAIFRGRRKLVQGAFIATLLSGNRQAVKRDGEKRPAKTGRYKGQMRQPLQVQYGATVAQMLAKDRRPERVADFARGVLADEVERLFTSFYSKPAKPAP